MDLIKVAIRNVGRNKRRSLITILTVIIGVGMVTGIRGILNGLQGEFRLSLTQKVHGDLQIHKTGYKDSLETSPYKTLMPWTPVDTEKLITTGHVKAVAPRLRMMGLFNHQASQTTVPVPIMAIDSAAELNVCPRFKDTIREGHLFDSTKERMSGANTGAQQIDQDLDDLGEAAPLTKKTPVSVEAVKTRGMNGSFHQIMVTPTLMQGSGAKLGDEVVILLQDKNNMQQAMIATIAGVIDYGLPNAANRMIWVDYKSLQYLLGIEGELSEIAISLNEPSGADEIRSLLAPTVGGDRVVETWLEIAGFFRDIMNMQDYVFNVVLGVVFIIVVSAIVNTSLMTVMERTREVGTLMALGYRRKHILWLFLVESMTIGMTGGVAGLLIFAGLLRVLSHGGMVYRLPGQAFTTVLYPFVSLPFMGFVFLLAVTAAWAAALVPSYRASRMKPVEALAKS